MSRLVSISYILTTPPTLQLFCPFATYCTHRIEFPLERTYIYVCTLRTIHTSSCLCVPNERGRRTGQRERERISAEKRFFPRCATDINTRKHKYKASKTRHRKSFKCVSSLSSVLVCIISRWQLAQTQKNRTQEQEIVSRTITIITFYLSQASKVK